MALLRNLEQSLSGLVEGTIGRVFRTEVRPTEIARKLAREMEINKRVSLSRTYAPTDYLVYLSPDDRARYAGVEASIAEELGAYLLEHARRERLVLVRRPLVEFRTDKRLRLGEFGIEARTAPISAEEAPPRPDPQAAVAEPAAPRDRDSRSRAGDAPRDPAPEPSAPLGSHEPSGGYEPPSAIGAYDDAPYEDPYAGDPFGGGGEAAPHDEPVHDEGDAYAWEDPPPAREPAGAAEPAYDDASELGGDWLDPVDDWEPEPAAPEPPRQPEPPRPAPEQPRPAAPRAPEPAAMPWIDPTLPRQSRPQFAPPVVPSRREPPAERRTTLLVDGTPHELTGERVVLGRSRTADVVISDPSVSRQHCELRRDDRGNWYALDLGSTNGSELDGESLEQPRRIAPGQRIKLGHAPAIIEVR